MTSKTDIVNLALQVVGTRTTVTDAQIANNTSNEAIQANLIYDRVRRRLLRMAPWNCAKNTAQLVYVTSLPGTPENQSPATPLWTKGQPAPPWVYEYQYPVDCERACWIAPQTQTGYAGAVPITTAVTSGAPSTWLGQPVRYNVAIDQFYPVTAAAVAAGGTGYAVGDEIILASGPVGDAPIGAPVVLRVLTAPAGVIATVEVVNQVFGSTTPQGGSYFARQTNPQAQGSTTGVGTGATFNLTYGAKSDQRIILTNQEFALLAYVKNVTDPNVMDEHFIEAWSQVLGAGLTMALTGDKGIANNAVAMANQIIQMARSSDGNEGLTINDITPDWLRIRGVSYNDPYGQGYGWGNFDWGNNWPMF